MFHLREFTKDFPRKLHFSSRLFFKKAQLFLFAVEVGRKMNRGEASLVTPARSFAFSV